MILTARLWPLNMGALKWKGLLNTSCKLLKNALEVFFFNIDLVLSNFSASQ
jgi:hypothetical protein